MDLPPAILLPRDAIQSDFRHEKRWKYLILIHFETIVNIAIKVSAGGLSF